MNHNGSKRRKYWHRNIATKHHTHMTYLSKVRTGLHMVYAFRVKNWVKRNEATVDFQFLMGAKKTTVGCARHFRSEHSFPLSIIIINGVHHIHSKHMSWSF